MKQILDAEPLIASLNRNDRYHNWACETLARLGAPLHTCLEVLAEAAAMTGQPQPKFTGIGIGRSPIVCGPWLPESSVFRGSPTKALKHLCGQSKCRF